MIFLKVLRDFLLEDTTLAEKLGNRIYPTFLYNVKEPIFPCLNFSFGGGIPEFIPDWVRLLRLDFWVWSQKSYSEASSIYNRLRFVLSSKNFNDTSFSVVLSELVFPSSLFEPESRLYFLRGIFGLKGRMEENSL